MSLILANSNSSNKKNKKKKTLKKSKQMSKKKPKEKNHPLLLNLVKIPFPQIKNSIEWSETNFKTKKIKKSSLTKASSTPPKKNYHKPKNKAQTNQRLNFPKHKTK
jgi:hypothetical protein